MSVFDWFLIGWWALSIAVTAGQIGRPRKPLEPLAGAFACLICLGLMAGLMVSRGVFA